MVWAKNSRFAKNSFASSLLVLNALWIAEKWIGLAGLPDDADKWLTGFKRIASMIPDPLGWASLGATCVCFFYGGCSRKMCQSALEGSWGGYELLIEKHFWEILNS